MALAGVSGGRQTRSGWSFLLPFLLVYLAFLVLPLFQALWMGFYERDLLTIDQRTFTGLDNYKRMLWGVGLTWQPFAMWTWRLAGMLLLVPLGWAYRKGRVAPRTLIVTALVLAVVFVGLLGIHPGEGGRWNDSRFWPSFGNTVKFVLYSTPSIVGVGLLLAVLLSQPGKFIGFLRTLFFAPYVLSVAVLTLIWAFLLNPQLGLVASLWESVGLEPVSWLTSTRWAMPAIVVVTLWWTVGFNMVLFIAGLQDIDRSQYEAAAIDGASRWQSFWYITLPGLQPTILLVVVLQVIASFQIFGQVHILTQGGPAGATEVSIQHIYETAFTDFELGYSSAMSVVLFVVMVSVSALQFKFMRGDDS